MVWIYFYLIPLAVAWKKRTNDPASEVVSLYATMFSVFVAVWCEALAAPALARLLPQGHFCRPWINCVTVILLWIIVQVIFNKVLEQVIPQGLDNFIFPPKAAKPLAFAASFFNTGLICAMLFTILAISPLAPHCPFIAKDDSLCASARLRILSNSFFIDRFSWQSTSINQRRRAFDRFIPENSGKVNTSTQSRKVN